jgi:uncharacterized protein YpmS
MDKIDILFILTVLFFVLLALQIAAILKIIQLKAKLSKMIADLSLNQGVISDSIDNLNLRICQFCKYRQSFINTTSESAENFYYRCIIRNRSLKLNQSCKYFTMES